MILTPEMDSAAVDGLPIPTPAAELNRFLFTASALDTGEGAAYDSVLSAAAARNFGGRIADHAKTFAFGEALGLLRRTGERFQLTRRGKRFLSLNKEQNYELTVDQQRFLNLECIGVSKYAKLIAEILAEFQLDAKGSLAAPALDNRRPTDLLINLVGFLRETGFLTGAGDTMRVAPAVQPEAARLLSGAVISLTELMAILEARSKRAATAELWVAEYERQRLRALGCVVEADAVRIISEHNVCAGYDVESFDTAARPFVYNRFIEVKSTTLETTEFIWSQNEIETARRLKSLYWIYLLSSYQEDDSHDLTLIQHPVSELREGGRLVLEPLTYRAVFTARMALAS